ncbi:MAG TPA: 16S rRNA (cytidine(1402)-2'-O)-methyltransferase [Anaerolineae bacterium]|nr:16S rRNA (cytidine(1402)-2'-O)-methyltransferase [Anaerolineae bacterium]
MVEGLGKLYVCATPIGNLEDITLRVLRVLKEVDLIAAEDTRVTRKLLAHYGIHTRMTSYHEHNEASKGPELIEAMKSGKTVALVSDAGMPGISDPGHRLIKACIEQGIPVEAVPGPSSLITALVISGLPTDSFVFQGFLPRKKGERIKLLTDLLSAGHTIILFESPRRIATTLAEVADIDPLRDAVIARELTKKFEEVLRGTVTQLLELLERAPVKGEIVLLFGPARRERVVALTEDELRNAVIQLMKNGVPKKQAISEIADKFGVSKRTVYEDVKDIHEEDIKDLP